MSDYEFAGLLDKRMREIARAVFEEAAHDFMGQPLTDSSAAKLREQIAFIKAKEYVTVKEASLLLSCSESHFRKLVRLARKGKSRRPIPYVDIEGVTVFPLSELSDWARPESKRQKNEHAINKGVA
jgi:hypothetical protein